MNHKKSNLKINRRKFLAGSLSTAALTGGAILLGHNNALANSLMGMTDPEWQITVDGKVMQEGKFTNEREDFYIPVKNGTAHIVLAGNRIFVHEDNEICEKEICSKMGSISKSGESLTCLPNKLVVRVL